MTRAPLLSATLLMLLASLPAQAASCTSEDGGGMLTGECTTSANSFVQTINAMRLLRDNGDSTYTFVDVGASPTAFDFASVSAGGDLGALLSGATVPDGTYVAMSPIIDKMATINASVTVDGMDCRTDSGGYSNDGGSATDYTYDFTIGSPFSSGSDATYDYASAPAEYEYLNGDGDLTIVKKFSTPFIVNSTSTENMTIEMAFDAADAASFRFEEGSCVAANLGPLNVSITIATE